MVHKCDYKGKTELCLVGDGYPVTKNKKIDCDRVRNAIARGSQFHVLKKLGNSGIRKYIKRCGIDSSKF